ncbi:MAG: hypothetical protein ACOC80_13585, partial [Petrotogales bacterium]
PKEREERNKKAREKYKRNRDKKLEYMKKYYSEHKEKKLEYMKKRNKALSVNNDDYREYMKQKVLKYYENNKKKILEKQLKYYHKNKERINKKHANYHKKKYATDVAFKVKTALRTSIKKALDFGLYNKSLEYVLGCTHEEFITHISSQFKPGMSWQNRSEWHLDHIIPTKKFDLSELADIKKCYYYKNLQVLWASENRSKAGGVKNVKNVPRPVDIDFIKELRAEGRSDEADRLLKAHHKSIERGRSDELNTYFRRDRQIKAHFGICSYNGCSEDACSGSTLCAKHKSRRSAYNKRYNSRTTGQS